MEKLPRNKVALITGISGQDGSYLAEYLLELGYEVHGIIRRNSIPEHQESRVATLPVKTYYSDLSDISSLTKIIRQVQPDEIYNLAAQSHVRISFEIPEYTFQINALGFMNLLEVVRSECPDAKVYQASSSEMFGNGIDSDGYQRITTPMHPVSPYGVAKLAAFNLCRVYRESYGMKVYTGILFNHESPRRGSNFVTQKIVKHLVLLAKGKINEPLRLGNPNARRDWGHSWDYVRAMHLIMQQPEPCEYVVSTGACYSVSEFVDAVIKYIFEKESILIDSSHIRYFTPEYMRPNELNTLRGDHTPISKLGWEPILFLPDIVKDMVQTAWEQY